MRVRVIVVGSLAAFGFAGWLAFGGGGSSDAAAPARTATANAPVAARAATAARRWSLFGGAAPAQPAASAPEVQKLDPRSDAFRNRMDEQIPERLYGDAAVCYHGGLKRDQRLDVEYHIHVADGSISITDVHITDKTIDNRALEECVKQKILAAKWKDDQLPDLDEDDDLYMRVDGWNQYIANAERDSDDNGG